MNDDAELVEAKAALAEAIAQMPADLRAVLPTRAAGEPQVEIVHALYRYEGLKPGEVRWIEVRELSIEEWDAAIAAHRDVYRFTWTGRLPVFRLGRPSERARRVAAAAA